jgi:nucleoside-diphosphate-sugar epimerase
VLGGTGFIGQELIRQLSTAGCPTRLLVRTPGKLPPEFRSGPLEAVRGDLSRDPDLRDAMRGIDCVIHLARAQAKTWAEYERDEIDVTRRVGEAALAAGVKRLVYTGTIDSYYAGAGAGVVTEKTPLDPKISRRNLYARAKAASEALLLRMHRERALPLVICRPGIVIGKGGSPFHWGVGMWWHGSVCEVWGDGRNKLPLVLVEDVARALVLAAETPGLEGQSFNLVADPCLSANDYLDAMDRCGGFRLQRYPTSIAKFYAIDLAKWFVKLLLRHPERRFPSYRDWESRTQRATFDCTQAKTRLRWTPVSDPHELIRRGIQEPLRDLLG